MGRLLATYDPLRRADSFIYGEMRRQLAYDYIARRLITLIPLDASIPDRLFAMGKLLGNSPESYAVRIQYSVAAGRHAEAARIAREAVALYPDNDVLRYEFLRPFMSQLAFDKAPPEIAAEAELLQEPASLLLQARRFAARNEWAELSRLDRALAQVRWTDPWKYDAIHARADWRSRVSTPTERERLGDEGIALLEPALVVNPTLSLYALRARCAIAAGRPDVLVESLWTFGQGTFITAMNGPKAERENVRKDLENVISLLDREGKKAGADPARFDEVRTHMVNAISRLGDS
jgi:hypothetical protein